MMKPLPIRQEFKQPRRVNTTRSSEKPPRAYQVLLVLSTLLAALFCILYLTKPVVETVSTQPPSEADGTSASKKPNSGPEPSLLPNSRSLPGETPNPNAPQPTNPGALAATEEPTGPVKPFEETNLKIQHVLSATSPDGEIGRIVTDVPVLYQSRVLRWKPNHVAEARNLLEQMRAHREKTRALRAEGMMLLNQWQNLLARSIPASVLRADSPTLPVNQTSESERRGPAGIETSKSIEVETAAAK